MKPMADAWCVRGLASARDEKVLNFPVRGFHLLFQTRASLTGIHFPRTNRRSGCVWPYNSRKAGVEVSLTGIEFSEKFELLADCQPV